MCDPAANELIRAVLEYQESLFRDCNFGPFILVFGRHWKSRLEDSYWNPPLPEDTAPVTIRERLLRIESIDRVEIDYQMDPESFRLREMS